VKLLHLLRKRPHRRTAGTPTTVKFAGGMGTQIIQSAVYFALRQDGESALADLSYFDVESRLARVGDKGRVTHWFWQLDQYGLPRNSFEATEVGQRKRRYILADGAEMMELGIRALQRPELQRIFMPSTPSLFNLPSVASKPFLCIHVRRGDYVNVASHLVSDDEFIEIAGKFSRLVEYAVILSDSPFGDGFKIKMNNMFQNVEYLDKLDPYSSHWLMRQARILVCSNSTYSLTAALLNPDALVVMPKQWFGGNDREIEAPIQSLSNFQIMS
jgi:hypothetical protein